MIGGALALGLTGLVSWPLVRELRRAPVSNALRDAAPGQFADLSRGKTHYQWFGSEDGAVLVCVHGLTTPSFVWGGLIPDLVAMGYRVLTYDHYGRGFSDRPRGLQDAAFFTGHLTELLDHLNITDDITLMGYSMGGSVSAAWAADNPDRLRQLILLAPAGMGHDLGRTAEVVARLPILGDWVFHMAYPKQFREGVVRERGLLSDIPDIYDLQLQELHRRGFLRAVLSSLRGMLSQQLRREHQVVHQSKVPVTAIWGADDTVIPVACKNTLEQWNPRAEQAVIAGAGHGLAYTHVNDVISAIKDGRV
jgi:pimeloyl-ACP methyl ester carboxylesterase